MHHLIFNEVTGKKNWMGTTHAVFKNSWKEYPTKYQQAIQVRQTRQAGHG